MTKNDDDTCNTDECVEMGKFLKWISFKLNNLIESARSVNGRKTGVLIGGYRGGGGKFLLPK